MGKDFAALQEYWRKRLANYGCKTPSPVVDTMVNIWNQYQCHTTFNWSRSASFNEAGGRDGIGYRDTNQDTLGVVHAIPDLVREKLLVLLKGQLSEGYAMHGFQPSPGTRDPITYRNRGGSSPTTTSGCSSPFPPISKRPVILPSSTRWRPLPTRERPRFTSISGGP